MTYVESVSNANRGSLCKILFNRREPAWGLPSSPGLSTRATPPWRLNGTQLPVTETFPPFERVRLPSWAHFDIRCHILETTPSNPVGALVKPASSDGNALLIYLY